MCPRAFCWDLAPVYLQSVLNQSALLSLEDVDLSNRRRHHAPKSSVAKCHLTCIISFNRCNNPVSQVLFYIS